MAEKPLKMNQNLSLKIPFKSFTELKLRALYLTVSDCTGVADIASIPSPRVCFLSLCSILLNVAADASVFREVKNVARLWFRIQIHIQLDLSGQKHLSTEISFFFFLLDFKPVDQIGS